MGLGEYPVVRHDNEAAVEMTPAFTIWNGSSLQVQNIKELPLME